MDKPLDTEFNCAVLTIARKLFPTGFDISESAPSTLDELNQHVATTGRMLVYSGGSDYTIFSDSETNYSFRAWHDWCHMKGNYDFTTQGESMACKMQVSHLHTVYGENHPKMKLWEALLDIEINEQVKDFEANGYFVEDQYKFAIAKLHDIGLA
jgi:hypothetical protein